VFGLPSLCLLGCFAIVLLLFVSYFMVRAKKKQKVAPTAMKALKQMAEGVIPPSASASAMPILTAPVGSQKWSNTCAEALSIRKELLNRNLSVHIVPRDLIAMYPDLIRFKKSSLANGLRTIKRDVSEVIDVEREGGEYVSIEISRKVSVLLTLSFLTNSFLISRKEAICD
jgi:hypothetical protein